MSCPSFGLKDFLLGCWRTGEGRGQVVRGWRASWKWQFSYIWVLLDEPGEGSLEAGSLQLLGANILSLLVPFLCRARSRPRLCPLGWRHPCLRSRFNFCLENQILSPELSSWMVKEQLPSSTVCGGSQEMCPKRLMGRWGSCLLSDLEKMLLVDVIVCCNLFQTQALMYFQEDCLEVQGKVKQSDTFPKSYRSSFNSIIHSLCLLWEAR